MICYDVNFVIKILITNTGMMGHTCIPVLGSGGNAHHKERPELVTWQVMGQ